MSRSSTSRRKALLSTLAVGFLWTQCLFPDVSAKIVEAMQQGFYFSWSSGQATPIPIAAQCDVLHITWDRSSASGPSPSAPYYLQVYTSAFVVPLVIPAGSGTSFDWPVPFIPGTQFQICMMASNGVSGGCQQIYTVYQPPNTTLDDPPVCRNLTYPAGALDVTARNQDNSWSQYGWIDQCTDITITPNNGTPPFTYTIAPSLRPPINFTSDTKDAVDWTVSLAFGLPFWISVVDSSGSTWTNGPLHSGGGGSTTCLSGDTETESGISTGGAIGVAFGSLAIGLVVGALGFFLFYRRRGGAEYSAVGGPLALRRKSSEPLNASTYGFIQPPSSSASGTFPRSPGEIDPYIYSPTADSVPYNPYHTATTANSTASPPHSQNPSSYSDRAGPPSPAPQLAPEQQSLHAYIPSGSSSGGGAGAVSPTSAVPGLPPHSPIGGPGQHAHVYVVHHDAGRPPPVTVFTSDGTEVVELPPQYEPPPPGEASARPQLQPGQRRQPRGLPAKQPRVASNASAS